MTDTAPPRTPAFDRGQRQPSSATCFVCGKENPRGLHVDFFDDGHCVWTELDTTEDHQGWPGVVHGGITAALLDETIGRVAFLHDRWVQTARLTLRFLKPAPVGAKLRAVGELARDRRRIMEMRGELVVVGTGEVVADAEGTFVPLPAAARQELVARLGGDFEAWERWLAQNRSAPPAP